MAFLASPAGDDAHSYHQREAATLWRVIAFGQQRVSPGSGYWFDNQGRVPVGMAVFQYTVAGALHYRDAAGDRAVPPGNAVLFTHGEDSAYGLPADCRETYVCEWISFTGAGLGEHWRLLRQRHGSVIAFGEEVRQALGRLIELAAPRAGTDLITMAAAIHAFVMSLFLNLRVSLRQTQHPVEHAIDELLRNPAAPWSLKELAERHGCSREHLCRVFRRRLGSAPGAWLSNARVNKALQLLRETNLPLALVAEQSGFASTHTLARQIRQATGRSPRKLRNRG